MTLCSSSPLLRRHRRVCSYYIHNSDLHSYVKVFIQKVCIKTIVDIFRLKCVCCLFVKFNYALVRLVLIFHVIFHKINIYELPNSR